MWKDEQSKMESRVRYKQNFRTNLQNDGKVQLIGSEQHMSNVYWLFLQQILH